MNDLARLPFARERDGEGSYFAGIGKVPPRISFGAAPVKHQCDPTPDDPPTENESDHA